jgi:putative ABC transport system permease protein
MTPPRVPGLLLRLLLPHPLGEIIGGDLEEEWRGSARRSRPRYWALALQSIGACWIDRVRRFADDRPPHVKGDTAMQSLLQDIRYGWRLLWRNPGFSLAAILTLALGIGANSAIFSIVNVLSLKALPYHDPARVAFVLGWDVDQNEMRFNQRQADYLDLQRQATAFDALAAYSYLTANLTGGDMPDRVQAYRVTSNTFALLGVPAAIGRTFDDADVQAGRTDVAVIGHGLWQRRFGGDRSIVGRQIVVNGEPREVIGIMPARFEFPVFNFKGDLWMPLQLRDAERGQPAATVGVTVIGRLASNVAYSQAQSELDVLMAAAASQHPDTNRGLGARVIEMGRLDDEQAGPAIAIVLVTVALVLVLACANVANLLLARGVSRYRELAVRAAIGASRLRIGRQLLVEGVLLALAGGGLGIVFALVALQALRASLPDVLLTTMPNVEEIGIDRTTLGYTLAVSLLTSVMFGVLPAWRASRERFEDALKESASAGGSRSTRRLRTSLVVAEVALATVLMIGAGLLVRSFSSLQRVNPGFEQAGVLTMAMTLPDYKYPETADRRRFYDAALPAIEQLPSVSSAGLVNVLPFSTYDRGTRIIIDGAPAPEPGREPTAAYRVASPRYHETMRIPLVLGRLFDSRDRPDSEPVALINQTLSARHFAGRDPVGQRLRLSGAEAPWLTIIGVVGDVRHSTLTDAPQPEVYLPTAQAAPAMMMLAIRTAGEPTDLAGATRTAVQAIDPAQPVYHVKALDTLVGESILPQRVSADVMTLFSALALLLAAIGIYGVVAYGVSQQTREFGVRLALGATPRDLLRTVLGTAGLTIATGIALGIAGALAVSRLLGRALYGVSATDPIIYLTAAGLLMVTGLAACTLPAWRASQTRPMIALKAD